MNVNKVFVLFALILIWSCNNTSGDRWNIAVEPLKEEIDLKNVSQPYYNVEISNETLKKEFPAFFAKASDSLMTQRRKDEFSQSLNTAVNRIFTETMVKDSLRDVFARVKHYYPTFEIPSVYLFTGELNYQNPVLYYPKPKEMVIGLDWFLGENNKAYDEMNIPSYFKRQMNPANFKSKVVEGLADHMVHYDISKRKFIEKMIYEGKLLMVQDVLLPDTSDAVKIGYTQEQIDWAKANEAHVYVYFTEQELFYDDDKKLDGRFLEEAPFSKFFSDNDAETPGKIAAWMGWQICRSYLAHNQEVTIQEFLADNDYQKIFSASGYKPVN